MCEQKQYSLLTCTAHQSARLCPNPLHTSWWQFLCYSLAVCIGPRRQYYPRGDHTLCPIFHESWSPLAPCPVGRHPLTALKHIQNVGHRCVNWELKQACDHFDYIFVTCCTGGWDFSNFRRNRRKCGVNFVQHFRSSDWYKISHITKSNVLGLTSNRHRSDVEVSYRSSKSGRCCSVGLCCLVCPQHIDD